MSLRLNLNKSLAAINAVFSYFGALPPMRYAVVIVTGMMVASGLVPPSAIAQVPPTNQPTAIAQQPGWNNWLYFGRTSQGNHLDLAADSLRRHESGVFFTYYLNGRPVYGFTDCREPVWYVDGERVPATSRAANRMLNYICGAQTSRRLV